MSVNPLDYPTPPRPGRRIAARLRSSKAGEPRRLPTCVCLALLLCAGDAAAKETGHAGAPANEGSVAAQKEAALALTTATRTSPTKSTGAARRKPLAPPLGLGDVGRLLDTAHALLTESQATTGSAAGAARATACLEHAERYLAQVVRVTGGRVRYRWHPLGRKRFEPGVLNTKRFRLGDPVKGVMAVRLRARSESGRIYVERVELHDPAGNAHAYPVGRWLERDLPRREILYLDEPCEVSSVGVTARHDGDQTRHVYLSLGVPESPDHAREVAGLCRRALARLRAGDRPAARAYVERARASLQAFREAVGLIAANGAR